jgi:DDE superfamily endonuclease
VVLIVDETADEKSSADCAGASRQYSGTVGGTALCQVTVTLTLASPDGHALIGRSLYLPEDWAVDEERRELAGVRGQEMSGSWLVSSWLTVQDGQRLSAASTERFSSEFAASKRDPGAWLDAHHLGYFVSYQPAGRYWVFQGVECAVLLIVTALAVVVALGVIRRPSSRSA